MVNRNTFFKVLINLILAAVAMFVYFDGKNYYDIFITLSIISLLVFVAILITNPTGIASPYMLFIIVMFVYNCGQVWLNLFGVPIISGNYTITRYSDDLLSISLLFFILMVLSINIFFLSGIHDWKKSKGDFYKNEEAESKRGYFVLFWISFFVCLVYDFLQYRIAASSGYVAALYARSENELLYMCNCVFPFVIFLGLRLNIPRKQKVVITILSAIRYAVTTVLIGYRMQAIAFVLSLLVLLPSIVLEKNKRKFNVLMIIGIVLAGALSIYAADLRRGNSYIGLLDSYNSLIQELGGTFTDLPIVFRDIDYIGTAYGLSYVCAVIYLIPMAGHFFPEMARYVNLSSILYQRITIYGGSSLGGSMLAEFFYNFNWLSLIIAGPAVGFFLAKICNSLNENKCNPYKTAMLTYVFYIMLLFVRGNIGEVTIYIRCAVYIAIIRALINRSRCLR